MSSVVDRTAVPHLMPRRPNGPLGARGLPGWLIRAGLWLAAVSIVVVPVALALRLLNSSDDLPDRPRSPAAQVTEQEHADWRAAGAALAAVAPPVVLSYHDIRPGSSDGYVVSPELLERQLVALADAGYRTLTSQEYVSYLGGAAAGPRSVYLTFDDGTEGLYLYADKVLERLRMHGSSYLISGRVGTHRPYYLTWAEVGAMARSGRWDLQAHTHDLHTRGAVGTDRADGSLLTGRAWDDATGALETDEAHRSRVTADVDAQLADFAEHGLPRPELFAYPFSDLGSHQDNGTNQDTASIIDGTYAGAFTNESSSAAPTSRRASVGGEIQRIEVLGTTTPSDLLAQVASWTAISPGHRTPLTDPGRWWDPRTRSVPSLTAFTAGEARTGTARHVQAAFAPFASADWTDYRVTADIAGLQPGTNNANITVRAGSAGQLTVRTAYGGIQVVAQSTGRIVAVAKVHHAAEHRVRIDVTGTATSVEVDGRQVARVAAVAVPAATGGIALASRRDADATTATFASLTVSSPAGVR